MTDVNPALIRQVLGDSLGYLYPAAMRVAARFRVADHLADGPKTADELASLSNVQAGHLCRVLRFLATRGVFQEDEAGRFHITPAAQLLRTDGPISLRSTVLLVTDEMYWRSGGRLDDTVHNGTTAFTDIFGAPLFEWIRSHPEKAKLFHDALGDLSDSEHHAIAATYEFPETGRVVDVGGGQGGLVHAILARYSNLHGVLFDQEDVVKGHRLDVLEIEGRWEAVGGDFFQSVPSGADVYVLKRIIHDWNDEDSRRILRSCRAAMPEGAKLLIIDTVIPPGNDPHPSKTSDLAMMIVFDGMERSELQYRELLEGVGFKLNRVIPTPSALSIVEAFPV